MLLWADDFVAEKGLYNQKELQLPVTHGQNTTRILDLQISCRTLSTQDPWNENAIKETHLRKGLHHSVLHDRGYHRQGFLSLHDSLPLQLCESQSDETLGGQQPRQGLSLLELGEVCLTVHSKTRLPNHSEKSFQGVIYTVHCVFIVTKCGIRGCTLFVWKPEWTRLFDTNKEWI